METHTQKFNGENYFNNKVIVDFVKKEVTFEPIKRPIFSIFISFFLSNLMFINLWAYILYLIASALFALKLVSEEIFIYSFSLVFLIVFILTMPFLNKKWRETKYATYNMFCEKYDLLNLIIRRGKTREVEPRKIINNTFFIEYFKNIFLEYKLIGDYARYIKKIVIDTNKKDSERWGWYAYFVFKKKPKDGKFYVAYI